MSITEAAREAAQKGRESNMPDGFYVQKLLDRETAALRGRVAELEAARDAAIKFVERIEGNSPEENRIEADRLANKALHILGRKFVGEAGAERQAALSTKNEGTVDMPKDRM